MASKVRLISETGKLRVLDELGYCDEEGISHLLIAWGVQHESSVWLFLLVNSGF